MTLTAEQIEARVIVLAQNETCSVVTAASRLEEDLGLDSLDRVELVMAIEEDFSLLIADAEAEACKTVGGLAELVKRLVLQRL